MISLKHKAALFRDHTGKVRMAQAFSNIHRFTKSGTNVSSFPREGNLYHFLHIGQCNVRLSFQHFPVHGIFL